MASAKELLIKIQTLFGREGTDAARKALDETATAATTAAQKTDTLNTAQDKQASTATGAANANTGAARAIEQAGEAAQETGRKVEAAADAFEKLRQAAEKEDVDIGYKKLDRDDVTRALKATETQGSSVDRLRGSLDQLGANIPIVGRLGSAISALATGPIAIAAGAIGGLFVAWKGAKAALSAYLGESRKLATLDAVLAQQGQLTAAYRLRLVELAGEMQNVTSIADDQWYEVLQKLTQFGSRPETIGMDVEAVKNLAGLVGGNLTQATLLYARALQGQFDNFSEVGIVIDKNLQGHEKLAELQRIVAERGAGVLEASAKSLSGGLEGLKNEVGRLAEGFGRLLFQNHASGLALDNFRDLVSAVTLLLPKTTGQLGGLENRQRSLAESSTLTADKLRLIGEEARAAADGGLARLADQYDRLAERTARATEAFRANIRAEQARDDAQLEKNLAGIDLAEQRGEITAPQAAEQRDQARQQSEAARLERERRLREEEIRRQREALTRARQGLGENTTERDRAQAGVDERERRNTFLEEGRLRGLQAQEQTPEVQAATEAAQKEYDANAKAIAEQRAKIEQLNKAIEAQTRANERLEAAIGDRIAALRAEQRGADEVARINRETREITGKVERIEGLDTPEARKAETQRQRQAEAEEARPREQERREAIERERVRQRDAFDASGGKPQAIVDGRAIPAQKKGKGTVVIDGKEYDIDDLPRRADGGDVEEDKPHIVGEKGPEIFTPKKDGVITPNAEARARNSGGSPVIRGNKDALERNRARNSGGSPVIRGNKDALERNRARNRERGIDGSDDSYVGEPGQRTISGNAEAINANQRANVERGISGSGSSFVDPAVVAAHAMQDAASAIKSGMGQMSGQITSSIDRMQAQLAAQQSEIVSLTRQLLKYQREQADALGNLGVAR